ncbi:MAG: 4-alpha-glucanotransferase, partial [Anaerolineales bacterium]|nr:4-alpha-glucanotransferase [Anaerolineales bacterium]
MLLKRTSQAITPEETTTSKRRGCLMKYDRSSGILLHPTSLPGPYGIGDIGPQAHDWIDFLAENGCSLWQVLP